MGGREGGRRSDRRKKGIFVAVWESVSANLSVIGCGGERREEVGRVE